MSARADTYPWFRCYSDVPGQITVKQLTHFEFRVFVVCMSFANRSPEKDRQEGALTVNPSGEPLAVEYIADEARGDVPQTLVALDVLQKKKLIARRRDGAYVVVFRWHQYPSDSSTPRTRNHRDKKQQESLASMPKQNTAEQNRTKENVSSNVVGTFQDCGWCGGSGQADGQSCIECDGSGKVPPPV